VSVEIDFTPEDRAPDPEFVEVERQAMLTAHYLCTLKEAGRLSEYEAIEVTREWLAACLGGDDD
jgi:hypothetical protein